MKDGDRSTLYLVDVGGSTVQDGTVAIEVLNLTRQQKTSTNRSGQPSIAAELTRLAELRDDGIINESDWGRAKDLFLGKPEDQQDRAAHDLRQLNDLYQSGVLSQSEFDMKKWDVLSRTK